MQSPHDAPTAAVNAVNGYIAPTMKLTFTASGATMVPAVPDGSVMLSQPVRVNTEETGSLHLVLPRDEDALTLQVPYDGSVRSLRALLGRLDEQAVPVGGLSVHTPDLDDVFFALTGHPHAEMENSR